MYEAPSFSTLLTRSDVAAMLRLPPQKLTFWIWALNERQRYREFEIARRSGGSRVICAPIKPIKEIQRTLADLLIKAYTPSPAHVHGFVAGRSIVSNAEPHRRQVWVLRTDLVDFFPSINFGRVRGMFMAYPFDCPEDVATILAQICCHRNELPQGAPTSPIVSNFICRGLDKELAKLAKVERCHYSRYADDITFSTNRTTFPQALAFREGSETFSGHRLNAIISEHGFKLNDKKTRLIHRAQRQRVTGLVVNNKPSTPREYARSLRKTLYIWRTYGQEAAEAAFATTNPHPNWPPNKPRPRFADVIRGRVQYVGAIKGRTSPIYLALARDLSAADPSFRAPRLSSQSVRLYTEGITDKDHLSAAIRYFHDKQEFLELSLEWDETWTPGGDKKLREQVRSLPTLRPSVPSVCLFDRDKTEVLKELDLTQRDWNDHGNGVAAAALVSPQFRKAPLCIELLYTDVDLLKTDTNGRRLYRIDEFDERSGHHHTETASIPNNQTKALICDEVFEFGSTTNIALSKSVFSRAVLAMTPPFDTMSFEGFRPTFEALLEAVASISTKIDKS